MPIFLVMRLCWLARAHLESAHAHHVFYDGDDDDDDDDEDDGEDGSAFNVGYFVFFSGVGGGERVRGVGVRGAMFLAIACFGAPRKMLCFAVCCPAAGASLLAGPRC